jgi:hypothetical protein
MMWEVNDFGKTPVNSRQFCIALNYWRRTPDSLQTRAELRSEPAVAHKSVH